MPKTKPPVEEKKITIRIPVALHAQLVSLAQRDTRSLNSEIVVLLQEATTARQK